MGSMQDQLGKLQAMRENLEQDAEAYDELYALIPQPHGAYDAKDIRNRPFFFGMLRNDLADGSWVVSKLCYVIDGCEGTPIPALDIDGSPTATTMYIPIEGEPRNAHPYELALVRIGAFFNSYGMAEFHVSHSDVRSLGSELTPYKSKFVLNKLATSFHEDKPTSLDDILAFFSKRHELATAIASIEAKLDQERRKAGEYEAELDELRKELKASVNKCDSRKQTIEQLKRHGNNLEQRKSELYQQAMELEQENQRLRQQIEHLEAENVELAARYRQANRQLILEEIERRGIEYFVHFTQIENLPSILEHGLCTLDSLNDKGVATKVSDDERLEGGGAICLSVSHPNYLMLWKKAGADKETLKKNWCIILIKPEYVIERNPRFYENNAASKIMQSEIDRESFEDFCRMFDPIPGKESIGDKYTSDPQAEVQVSMDLPVESFYRVVFLDDDLWDEYKDRVREIGSVAWSSQYGGFLFEPRSDYKYW